METARRLARRARALAAIALIGLLAAEARADIILADNLSEATDSTVAVAGDTWLAASFATDGSAYKLSAVTLLLDRSTPSGSAAVDIYTDGTLQPGSYIGTLTSPTIYSTAPTPTTFTAAGISLLSNSTYWVVLRAPTGSFDWAFTDSNDGTGPGFRTATAESDDAGASWFPSTIFPYQMRVSADLSTAGAVPEPASLVLLGVGLAGLAARLRRRSNP